MNTQIQMTPVPFHGDTLYFVDDDGEPYAPIRPICDNLGIAWVPQRRKIVDNPLRWGTVTMMVTAADEKNREMVCLPFRKLPAWLLSIDPRKVKEEVRFKLEVYQNECDDALWAYWREGRAVNPRAEEAPGGAWMPVEDLVAINRQLIEYNELLKAQQPTPRKKRKTTGKKLNNDLVVSIYDLMRQGRSGAEIARELDVSTATVSYVRNLRPSLPLPQ